MMDGFVGWMAKTIEGNAREVATGSADDHAM